MKTKTLVQKKSKIKIAPYGIETLSEKFLM